QAEGWSQACWRVGDVWCGACAEISGGAACLEARGKNEMSDVLRMVVTIVAAGMGHPRPGPDARCGGLLLAAGGLLLGRAPPRCLHGAVLLGAAGDGLLLLAALW